MISPAQTLTVLYLMKGIILFKWLNRMLHVQNLAQSLPHLLFEFKCQHRLFLKVSIPPFILLGNRD